MSEGNSGTTSITFTVTLSHWLQCHCQLSLILQRLAAIIPVLLGTLTFAAGETTKTISVTVTGDQIDEGASETFKVNLTSPSNNAQLSATVGAAEAMVLVRMMTRLVLY
ncbi:MAG: hypothetical protein R3E08_13730 [Thiotrichaceae bacterium]